MAVIVVYLFLASLDTNTPGQNDSLTASSDRATRTTGKGIVITGNRLLFSFCYVVLTKTVLDNWIKSPYSI